MSINVKKRDLLDKFAKVDLYPVTCEPLSLGRSDFDFLDAVIKGGAHIIQLRDKLADKDQYRKKALRFREKTREHGILLILNDHADIAAEVDADGIHLGQDDLSVAQARELLPDKIIGVSTHNPEEARAAQAAGADYVNIGPIYQTQTKEGISYFLGPEKIRQISRDLIIPFTVMGGIKKSHIPELVACGAEKIALVTAVSKANNMNQAVKELRDLINNEKALQNK